MSSKPPPWRYFDSTMRLLTTSLLVLVICLAAHSFAIDGDNDFSFDSSAENEQHESIKFLPSTAANEVGEDAKALSTFPVAYEEGDAVDRFVLVERMHCLGVVHVYKDDEAKTSEESALVLSEYTGVYELLLPAAEEHFLLSDTPAFDTDSSAANTIDRNAALENLSSFERCGVRKSSFCLDQHIFRGGHGETWKAHLMSPQETTSTNEGTEAFVLKRMIVRDRPDILHCATREIFFGTLLQGQLEFSRFLSFFVTSLPLDTDASRSEPSQKEQRRTIQKQIVLRQEQRENGETIAEPQVFPSISASAADEVWLVFHDEGPSLQALLYAEQRANSRHTSTTVLLSPSLSWRKLRQSPSVTRALLRQLIEHVAKLHALGIVHRDIKPGNLLLRRTNGQEGPDEITLVVADFSSAILLESWTNENMSADVELYSSGGPTVREETLPYAPPEVLLSLCADDEEALLGMKKESHMKNKHEEQKVLLCSSLAFDEKVPQSYDIWSIGVVFLEMIVGTANVFDLDERTARLLALQLAKRDVFDPRVLRRAELLTALAEFGLWSPSVNLRSIWLHDSDDVESKQDHGNHQGKRAGHELLSEDFVDAMLVYLSTVPSLSLCRQIPSGSKLHRICEKSSVFLGLDSTIDKEYDLDHDHDRAQSLLAAAIRRRDPLKKGLTDKRALDLLSRLLHFNPARRMSLVDALGLAFFR